MQPFTIDTMTTTLHAEPTEYRGDFEREFSLIFDEPLAPALLRKLMTGAASASYIDDDVADIGKREIEAPQRVGGLISLVLARQSFCQWLENATGQSPLRAVAGRLVQTGTNGSQALAWHTDLESANRLLGVVVNLSDTPFTGGQFEMRQVGKDQPFLSHRYVRPGSMMIFPVSHRLEHRVAEVTSGGPRRVYSGWFLSEPEHPLRPR